jgi:hypothetical protein
MRKVAAHEAERRHLLELQLRESGFLQGEAALLTGVAWDDQIVAVKATKDRAELEHDWLAA